MRTFWISVFVVLSVCSIAYLYGEDADSLRAQGDEAYKARDFDKAIMLYKASLKLNRKNWQVHEALGNAYFKAKRYVDAATSYAEALGYNPQFTAAYYNMGFSYLKAGLYNEAIKNLEKYISLESKDPDGYYRLAECYYSVGEKDNAIKNYEKFLSMANKDVSQKKVDNAKAKLAKLKGSQSNIVALPGGASSSSSVSQTPLQPASIAVAPSPSTPAPVSPTNPGPVTAPSQTAKVEKSSATQTTVPATPASSSPSQGSQGVAKRIDPANDPAMEIIKEADNHLANGNYRLAIFTYRDALIKNPNSIRAHYNLGIALAKIERYEQAIAEWEKVLLLDPNNAGARENIQRAKAKISGASQPAPLVTAEGAAQPAAVQKNPQPMQPSPVNDLLAKASKANSAGDYATAIKYIEELMVIRKDVPESYIVKGDALLGMARYLDSINEFKKALALNPQLADPLFGMAEAYRLLAKTDMAIQYYKLFLNSPAPDKAKWRVMRAGKMLKALEAIR